MTIFPPLRMLSILLSLAISLAASIKVQARHDGKGHAHPSAHPDPPTLKARQESEATGPFGGISVYLLSGQSLYSHSTQTRVSLDMAPVSPILTTGSNIPTISSYFFPQTVVQVPVATICPDTPATSALFSILPMQTNLPMVNGSFVYQNGTGRHGNGTSNGTATDYLPPVNSGRYLVNATALLPNGSSTVFVSYTSTSTASSSTTPPPSGNGGSANTARIVLDTNGCQTLFTALTTSLCSTMLTLAGIPTVSITECNQWVTFSSETAIAGCDAAATTGKDMSFTTVPAVISSLISSVAGRNGGIEEAKPGTFYAANWYDLWRGGVPSLVRVEECSTMTLATVSETAVHCETASEAWSLSSVTKTREGSSVIKFQGAAVLSSSTTTLTTTLSFESTITTTTTLVTPTVLRSRLGAGPITSQESTITVFVTMPTTQTIALEEVTSTQMMVVTVQNTVTRIGTETRTRTRTRTAGALETGM